MITEGANTYKIEVPDEVKGINFTEYQQAARTTAIYPGKGEFAGLSYCGLGLAGEAGEAANKIKKMLRDDGTTRKPDRVQGTVDEIGDCLWYCANLAAELGTDLQIIAEMNLQKLFDRKQRGVLHGDGSHR